MKKLLEQLPDLLQKLPILLEQLKTLPDQVTELLKQFEGFYNLLIFTLMLIVVYIVLSALFLVVLAIIGLWRTFEKANESGWKALIPIYNLYILSKIIYGNGWQFILLLIPIINIYYAYRFSQDMAQSYGKSTTFGIGIFLLSPLFISIIGYGASEYQGTR
ncbi:DUF5684 domain-containing protein [Streptococcus marimammalium]|uniref:DUF5684 domain-containing protein n=1 Tax=Streptococcus marimammalium TaxID=269666 RepID=UPI00037778DF|nr:DUF5684 domain-containing protein [Streptococcus marimammalium]